MSIFEYLNEKLGVLLLNLSAGAALSLYLFALGLGINAVALIWITWGLILLGAGTADYLRLSNKYGKMKRQMEGLDKKYLIAELLDKPETVEEKIYWQMLKTADKSMLEEVSAAQNEYREYKEYIEEWIHEVKTPISAVRLICRNHASSETQKIAAQMFHISHLVEQALYYRAAYLKRCEIPL